MVFSLLMKETRKVKEEWSTRKRSQKAPNGANSKDMYSIPETFPKEILATCLFTRNFWLSHEEKRKYKSLGDKDTIFCWTLFPYNLWSEEKMGFKTLIN